LRGIHEVNVVWFAEFVVGYKWSVFVERNARSSMNGHTIMELELLLPKGVDEVALEVVGRVLNEGS